MLYEAIPPESFNPDLEKKKKAVMKLEEVTPLL